MYIRRKLPNKKITGKLRNRHKNHQIKNIYTFICRYCVIKSEQLLLEVLITSKFLFR